MAQETGPKNQGYNYGANTDPGNPSYNAPGSPGAYQQGYNYGPPGVTAPGSPGAYHQGYKYNYGPTAPGYSQSNPQAYPYYNTQAGHPPPPDPIVQQPVHQIPQQRGPKPMELMIPSIVVCMFCNTTIILGLFPIFTNYKAKKAWQNGDQKLAEQYSLATKVLLPVLVILNVACGIIYALCIYEFENHDGMNITIIVK